MSNWKRMAERRLLDYEAMQKAKENLPLEIARYKTPREGEDRLDMISRKIFMRERLRQVKRWLAVTQKGLAALTPEERLVVQMLYILPKKGNVNQLCGILNCGQTTVYRRRDSALQKFTMALYGRGT